MQNYHELHCNQLLEVRTPHFTLQRITLTLAFKVVVSFNGISDTIGGDMNTNVNLCIKSIFRSYLLHWKGIYANGIKTASKRYLICIRSQRHNYESATYSPVQYVATNTHISPYKAHTKQLRKK
jgi:hypothetical protein